MAKSKDRADRDDGLGNGAARVQRYEAEAIGMRRSSHKGLHYDGRESDRRG